MIQTSHPWMNRHIMSGKTAMIPLKPVHVKKYLMLIFHRPSYPKDTLDTKGRAELRVEEGHDLALFRPSCHAGFHQLSTTSLPYNISIVPLQPLSSMMVAQCRLVMLSSPGHQIINHMLLNHLTRCSSVAIKHTIPSSRHSSVRV